MKTRHLSFSASLLLVSFGFIVSSNGQSICDDLSVEIFRHPTVPNILVIRLDNQSDEFVNYPSLSLLYDGDVVAEGETTLFQFPEVSYHFLEPDMLIAEGESYTFTIDVYAIFGSEYVCSFEWTGVPYDPQGCFDGLFRLSASANNEQEVELVIRDEFDNVVLTQNIWIEFGNLSHSYPLCLPRACYTVSLEAVGSTFQSNYLLTWDTEGQTWFSRLVNASESFNAFELDVWEGCSFVSVSEQRELKTRTEVFPTLASAGAMMHPIKATHEPLLIQLFSTSGALVASYYGEAFTAPTAPGLYLLRIEDASNVITTQRMMVR